MQDQQILKLLLEKNADKQRLQLQMKIKNDGKDKILRCGETDMEELNKSGIVITLFSTASAVGKTLLSINMGAELARTGFRVCVVDLDLQYGDICNFLHIEPTKTIFDAQQGIQNRG